MDRQDASVGVSVMPPAADPDSNTNNKAKLEVVTNQPAKRNMNIPY